MSILQVIEGVDVSAADLFEKVRSGVFHIEHFVGERVVASGTGFLSRGLFLTNNHVFSGPDGAMVRLSSQPTSAISSRRSIDIPSWKWIECLRTGSPESNYDFAVLKLSMLDADDAHQFELRAPTKSRIGDPVALLGFPFGHGNLACHVGIVSSFIERNGVNVIQLDASVNVSNSGGPLIDLASGCVIGIVTRKAHGFTQQLEELKKIASANKEMADKLQLGPKPSAGISMGHAARESYDAQVKLIQELERSANVGIGYAFSIEHVLEDNALDV